MQAPFLSIDCDDCHWHIVVNHRTGEFLSRILISKQNAHLENETHLRKRDNIQLYLESDAIKFFPSTTPLDLKYND
ncbi:hypothetical protein LCGC14_1536370 [marine sediment metagenome]|uniref:Uncharacterized protein n=1 Tax=marine sediment metagenome TaxID=412755 RepID=A0A0F9LV81_9ZZZZ